MKTKVHSFCSCFNCGGELLDYVQIAWGAAGENYTVGDKLKWFQTSESILEPDVYYGESVMNYGSPVYCQVLAFDIYEYFPCSGSSCKKCGISVGGVAVLITDQEIIKIQAFTDKVVDTLLQGKREEVEVFVMDHAVYIGYPFPSSFKNYRNFDLRSVFKAEAPGT